MRASLRQLWRKVPAVAAAGLINLPVGTFTDSSNPNDFLPALANRIAVILTYLAYPLAFIGIVYSVYLLIANSGNPDALKTTKKNIGYIAIGIFLIVFTILIFSFVSAFFGGLKK